ncbi:MAG: Rieske (2Fe-2S) protein [Actinobacteria bacterium]|nr:MAG: Rieske (2Fe-2S) protein [Actinomycetota bacterium]
MRATQREARLPLSQAPDEGVVRHVEVGGRRVGLYRVDGELHALADRCPHRGAPLCSGRIATPVEVRAGSLELGTRASIVRCPWHKWEFEIASGRCLVDPKLRARTYAVRVDGDEIVVSLDH